MSYEYVRPPVCPATTKVAEAEILRSELLEWKDRAETAERRLSESLARNDRQEALIVELCDGLARLLDKIREAKQ